MPTKRLSVQAPADVNAKTLANSSAVVRMKRSTKATAVTAPVVTAGSKGAMPSVTGTVLDAAAFADTFVSTGSTQGGTGNFQSEGVLYQWRHSPGEHPHAYRPEQISQHASNELYHKDRITSVASIIDPYSNGQAALLATGSRDKLVKIWRRSADKLGQPAGPWSIVASLSGHMDWVNCITGLSQGEAVCHPAPFFVSGSRDCSLRLWTRNETAAPGDPNHGWACAALFPGVRMGEEDNGGHKDFVTCCDLLPDRNGLGACLASGSADWNVNIWDINRPMQPLRTLDGHAYAVRCCAWATERGVQGTRLSSTSVLASGSDDEQVRVWDTRAKYGGNIKTLQCGSPVLSVCWGGAMESAQGSWLAAGGGIPLDSMAGTSENIGGWLRVWDVRTWRVVGDCSERESSNVDTFYSTTYDGRVAAHYRAGGDGRLPTVKEPEYLTKPNRMWEGELKSRRAPRAAEGDQDYTRLAHKGFVSTVTSARLPDGTDGLVSGGQYKNVKVWSVSCSNGSGSRVSSSKPMGAVKLLACLSDGHENEVSSVMPLRHPF